MRRQGRGIETRFRWVKAHPTTDSAADRRHRSLVGCALAHQSRPRGSRRSRPWFRWAKAHPTSATGTDRRHWPLVGAHPTIAILVVLAFAATGCREEPPPRLLQQGDPEATIGALLELFDEVPADHPQLPRAEAVFERLRYVSATYAELHVLEMRRAPTALALPDRTVVLSREGLELCYRGVPPEEGDARLAFVLGHELAHLAGNDFWHASAFATVYEADDPTAETERLRTLLALEPRSRQNLELKADDAGILAMIQSGYDPGPLLDPDRTFFEEWVGGLVGSMAYADPDHPGVAERAGYLRLRLGEVAGKLSLFEEGLEAFQAADRLAAVASTREAQAEVEAGYEGAVSRFEAFRLLFSGREVLSNLALAHLRLAAGRLAGCDGTLVNRYYLPTALDPVTLATRAVLRGEREYSSPCFTNEDYQRHMKAAVRLLEEAVERDPGYLPARLNLVAAFVLDEREASAVVQGLAAAELAGDDPRAAAAPWVAYVAYHDRGGPIEFERVLGELADLHRRFPDDPGIAFNLASALSYASRPDDAEPVWREFLRVEPDGPWAKVARGWVGEEPAVDRVAAKR